MGINTHLARSSLVRYQYLKYVYETLGKVSQKILLPLGFFFTICHSPNSQRQIYQYKVWYGEWTRIYGLTGAM